MGTFSLGTHVAWQDNPKALCGDSWPLSNKMPSSQGKVRVRVWKYNSIGIWKRMLNSSYGKRLLTTKDESRDKWEEWVDVLWRLDPGSLISSAAWEQDRKNARELLSHASSPSALRPLLLAIWPSKGLGIWPISFMFTRPGEKWDGKRCWTRT